MVEKLTEEVVPLKPSVQKKSYCSVDDSPVTLLGRDKTGVDVFNNFLAKASYLNKTEKMVAWSLFQMNMRPDLATPSARFQVLTNTKSGVQYWDFKDSALDMDLPKSSPPMTFLYGLETILKTYSSRHSLRTISNMLDTHLPLKIPISADFAEFIDQNKAKLLEDKVFLKSFFKAAEQLRYGESIPKLAFTKIINNYYRFKNRISVEVTTSNQMYSIDLPSLKKGEEEVLCNVDIQKYSQSKYEISEDNRERHHPYAIKYKDGQFFLGVTSISNRNFRPMMNSFLMETTQDKTSVPLCYKNSTAGISAYLSFRGRDPGQYLYNMFQYNIHQSTDPMDLDQFIRYPRHLILLSPLRVLYESSRGTEEDLDKFVEQNIPIYHSQKLGEVWVYSPKSGFVIDDRGKAHLSCIK
tara:strand:+ start:95461 stop:96690 length:1230 start_codon:yes stop_codon:yes gene_type:complete